MIDPAADPDKFFLGACDFIFGTAVPDQLPEITLPEVAFAGRSNVGKSSLINALTNRKALARVSNTPGRTQQLNFFNLADYLHIVDMPGYGFAKVSDSTRQEWEYLIGSYLRGRPTLRAVFVLVDSRRGWKDVDEDFMTMLDAAAVPARIVMTKADEVKKSELEAALSSVREALKQHPAAFPEPLVTSSHEKQGLTELRAAILSVAE